MNKELTTTEKVIIDMLKENTGTHMLDSGGAYGRNWERNQNREFGNEPKIELSFNNGNIDLTKNIYHFLIEHLIYAEKMDSIFIEFTEMSENKNECGLEIMNKLGDYMIYQGFEVEDKNGNNSYNYENNLSQTIQFHTYKINGIDYILLQIHGGCDVRGGYTMPKVFTFGDDSDGWATFLCGLTDAYIECTNCDANWQTDDAYHWYNDGSCGLGADTQLEDYEFIELSDLPENNEYQLYKELDDITKAGEVLDNICNEYITAYAYKDMVVYDSQSGQALCPKCGGKLKVRGEII